MTDLQELVDGLASELARPVGIDDRRFRSLAYSSHFEHVDEVRLASLLHREAPREVMAWLDSLRIHEAEWYTRIPANPELDMAARVCVPVRWQELLLGYLWLIDAPERVSDAEIDAALRTAGNAALVLYRLRLLENADRSRERELVGRLLADDAAARAIAAEQLIHGGFIEHAPLFSAVVVQASRPELTPADAAQIRLAAAMEQLRRALAPRQLVTLVGSDLVAALIASQDAAEAERRSAMVLERAAAALDESEGRRTIVGVGEPRTTLADAHRSYREARFAAALADAVPSLGPLVAWASLGAYRTIALLLDAAPPADAIPASVQHLLACADADVLVPTLEAYLEHGGDARASSAALYVHRSSLYNRLHRIEEIAGVDLRSGDHRLELQLGLRLWRIAGLEPPRPGGRG